MDGKFLRRTVAGGIIGGAIGIGGWAIWCWWKNRPEPEAPYYTVPGAEGIEVNPPREEPEESGLDRAVYENTAGRYSWPEVEVARLSMEDFMLIPEEKCHVCTYFLVDDVLAGMDDSLEELDIVETLGDSGADILRKSSGSGEYLLVTKPGGEVAAYEIVIERDNGYAEEYAAYSEAILEE